MSRRKPIELRSKHPESVRVRKYDSVTFTSQQCNFLRAVRDEDITLDQALKKVGARQVSLLRWLKDEVFATRLRQVLRDARPRLKVEWWLIRKAARANLARLASGEGEVARRAAMDVLRLSSKRLRRSRDADPADPADPNGASLAHPGLSPEQADGLLQALDAAREQSDLVPSPCEKGLGDGEALM